MAVKRALLETLDELSEDQFDAFRFQLRIRDEKPKLKRNQVDGKKRYEIVDVMVSTLTASGAVGVAERILRLIDCNDEADALVKETSEWFSPGSSDNGQFGEAGAAGSSTVKEEEWRSVAKHRSELIKRVTNVSQILDRLLDEGVIDKECYDQIFKISTTQNQMRELDRVLQSEHAKKTFYIVLKEKEPHLMDELMRK